MISMAAKTVPFYRKLHNQVLIAALAGIVLGVVAPDTATAMKPLGDGYIKVVRMLIAPIVFCIIVSGVSGVESMKAVGGLGAKALAYFYAISTLALIIGLISANLLKPGAGMNVDISTLDASLVSNFATAAHAQSVSQFLLNIIPENFVDAFAKGAILQVLLISLLFAFALKSIGPLGTPVKEIIDRTTKVMFAIVEILMVVSPIGAFGGMAFTIGAFGLEALLPLLKLMVLFTATCLFFVVAFLVPLAAWVGFSVFKLCKYILEEILIQFSVASSEVIMPRLMEKMERLGVAKSVVGLVIPAGYSFNLDGTAIYMTFAVVFIAQAINADLTLQQELVLVLVAMLTSKGASGFANAGFIVLAATLSVLPTVPIAGLALILGIDPFMSRMRGLTNLIGNSVGVVVIAAWAKSVDMAELRKQLDKGSDLHVADAKQM
jgi:aerobic C4-dicarboxylate transport protein